MVLLLYFLGIIAFITEVCHAANFVLVLTDDQDLVLNGLMPMRRTIEMIANGGATFTNAFVHSPICCPSRSSLLTGRYLHNIHVRNNSLSGNCSSVEWQRNHEPYTIANFLHQNGYHTFYAGKYLNQYGNRHVGGTAHVPAGYDWWMGLVGNARYYDYTLSINGTARRYNHTHDDYLTDVIRTFGLEFLDAQSPQEPFLMIVAPPAAHAPFEPAFRHSEAFPTQRVFRTPSFNQTPIAKHWMMQLAPKHLPDDVKVLDEIQKRRFQTLLAVDEMVAALKEKVAKKQMENETYWIFTSDNGFHVGQFGQPWDKRQPYETDIRIPLLISGPGIASKTLRHHPVSLVDLAPTIFELAQIGNQSDAPHFDGVSLVNVLLSDEDYEREQRALLVEYFGEGAASTVSIACEAIAFDANNLSECSPMNWCKCEDARNNTYACVRHIDSDAGVDFKYCQFDDDIAFREAYNLTIDPYELENVAFRAPRNIISKYKTLLERLVHCEGEDCNDLSLLASD